MTLRESLLALKRGWIVVVVAVVAGVALAALLSSQTNPAYVSSARLFVAAQTDTDDAEELFQRNQIAVQRMVSYVELVGSEGTAEEAARVLGGGTQASSLTGRVTASTVPSTVIIDLQATGSTPEDAQRLAQAYTEAVPRIISEVERVGDGESAQVSVTPIASPGLGVSSRPGLARELVLGGLVGLVLGAALVLALHVIRRDAASRAPVAVPSSADDADRADTGLRQP